jgi:hypothetical protein
MTPVFANVLNSGKMPRHLADGTGQTVTVNPGQTTVPVPYSFTIWQNTLPPNCSILNYTMDDGSVVKILDESQVQAGKEANLVLQTSNFNTIENQFSPFVTTDSVNPAFDPDIPKAVVTE